MTSSIDIIVTGDGSHSLLNTELQETYHSRHGAIRESRHVFIQCGLEFVARNKKDIRILEIGFGTGLNALLSLQRNDKSDVNIHYTSLETFPLQEQIWSQLNYVSEESPWYEDFKKLHYCEWNQEALIRENFFLIKINEAIQQFELPELFDLVYYDAFAPSKQPEMWELPTLRKVVQAMEQDGVFVTYCAKGQLKRDLKLLGLVVETLPGPPGKKEMVRAVKTQSA